MFDDEDVKKPAAAKTFPRNLEGHSIDELKHYITELEAEITRVQADIAAKIASHEAAASVFKS